MVRDGASEHKHLHVDDRSIEETTALFVTLNRPTKLNALPRNSVTALVQMVESVSYEEYDVLVVRGAGDHFCAGVDMIELREALVDGNAGGGESIHDVVHAIRTCSVPVVTEVTGVAFGLGFLLCMAADTVIASEDASFGLKEVNLGIPVAGWAAVLLPRIVGEHRARDWLFTGRTVGGAEANAAGFVTETAPENERSAVVEKYVRCFGSSSSRAITMLKDRMGSQGEPADFERLRTLEQDDLKTVYADDDVLEQLETIIES